MGRTAAPATPGTDPNAAPEGDASAAVAVVETAEQRVERLERETADLRALVHQLGRNQAAQVRPELVELPELADVMKDPPKIPVLTKQGWLVPPILPGQQKA